jgi:CRP-like cAMP-binding protein
LKVSKGQIIQRKGDLNTKVYRVESGLVRSYSIDEKGKEHIYMFAPENWIMADNCEANIPCELYIDALEDSVLIVSEKKITETEFDSFLIFRRLGTLQKRIIMLMSSSAIERYKHFAETYPDIIQRVPQKMIASYLGITPEALSSVKSKMVKGN